MPQLLSSFESAFETDFGLVYAGQSGGDDVVMTMTYAASVPGYVAMMSGTKYANLEVRIERWDARPPLLDDGWEDLDELPWITVPDGGLLRPCGFDHVDSGPGLSLDGLERGRIQVLAAGRHRYADGTDPDTLPPERWLLRVWPDELGDALTGPPRRVAGPLPLTDPPNAWFRACRSWASTGWSTYLLQFPAFRDLELELALAARPVTSDDLMDRITRRYPQQELAWTTPVRRPLVGDLGGDEARQALGVLAAGAGMVLIETYADALTCLLRLGMVGRLETGALVPNPAPASVWTVLDLPSATVHGVRMQALASHHGHLEDDLLHVVRWGPPSGVVTTPERMAVRLGLPAADVIATIELLGLRGSMRVSPDVADITPRTEITLVPTG